MGHIQDIGVVRDLLVVYHGSQCMCTVLSQSGGLGIE